MRAKLLSDTPTAMLSYSGGARIPAQAIKGRAALVHVCVTHIATMAVSKIARYQNGVPMTRQLPRKSAGFRRASEFVAAIDFGTTFCSVAYILQGSKEILKLPIDGPLTRVPNAILVERKTNTVMAFGSRARENFSLMKKGDRDKVIFFERMKMILYREQVSLYIIMTKAYQQACM